MQVSALACENGLTLQVADIFRFPSLAHITTHISVASSNYIPHLSLSQYRIDPLISTKVYHILGLSSDHVLEILPATSFQNATLSAQPCRYFLIPINHYVNIPALSEATLTLSKHHDVLRTAFATIEGQTFQVILRDNPNAFSGITTCEDLVHFSRKLCLEDSFSISPFGTSLFRITLVSRGTSSHMLILRISHAQYDGISFSQLLKNLSLIYAGNTLSSTISFSHYIHYRQSLKTKEMFEFWRSYLRGSSIQSLSALSLGETNTDQAKMIHLVQKIPIPELAPNLTLATVTKTAWALVFAKLMGVKDLVLGQLVSGRNIPMMGIQNVIGPTINIVPARFSLKKSWVIMDLLQHVQDRHVETVDFESLDFRDIVKNCTQWPETSRLDCIVQHQLADENIPFSLNGSVSHVRPMLLPPRSIPMDFHGLTLSSHTTLEVHVTASSMLITKSLAEFILKDFCQTIPFLLRNTTLPLETVIPFGCD